MAKVVSTIFSSMRGSIAGQTYLTTPAGQIIARQRTRPVQAPSPARTNSKDAMTQAVTDWAGLTSAKRQAWDAWAAAQGGGSGRHQFIAGQQLIDYIINAGLNGVTVIAADVEAPQFTGHPSFTLAATNFVTPAQTGIAFKITNTSGRDVWAFVEISTGLSASRNYWKGPWDGVNTQAHRILKGATTTQSVQVPLAGLRHFVRVRTVTDGTGETPSVKGRVVSSALITFCVSVTNP